MAVARTAQFYSQEVTLAHHRILIKIISVSAILLVFFSLPIGSQPAPPIAFSSRTVLIGAEGRLNGKIKLIDMGPGKMGWIQSWDNGSSIEWKTAVEHAGDYQVASILESSGTGCDLHLVLDERTLHTDCGEKGWKRVQFGLVHLPSGPHTLKLSSFGVTPLAKFFSLEFVRPQVEAQLDAEGRKQIADTRWMTAAGYGLMFHWTSQTLPRQGPPQSYCDAVRNFDVERFANTVDSMGAGFVVFTTSHAGFYFPGPNPVIDSILPGRTCPRDLVGDLADALNSRKIRLELYFHPGHDDAPWWQRTHFDEPDKTAYFAQWGSIIAQVGRQYGKRLAGFWFDDAAFTYYPFNPSWQQMTAAARTGNPQRIIAYNSWILPKLNAFYDVFAGENGFWEPQYEDLDYLPIGGTGRYTGGPQQGLQAELTAIIEDNWGHFKRDSPIPPPRITADDLIPKLKDALSRKMVPLLDVEIYQDGTISPQTLQLFQAVRAEIRPANPPPN
jgi:hypothetical protein